jgi:hypothetical protein
MIHQLLKAAILLVCAISLNACETSNADRHQEVVRKIGALTLAEQAPPTLTAKEREALIEQMVQSSQSDKKSFDAMAKYMTDEYYNCVMHSASLADIKKCGGVRIPNQTNFN